MIRCEPLSHAEQHFCPLWSLETIAFFSAFLIRAAAQRKEFLLLLLLVQEAAKPQQLVHCACFVVVAVVYSTAKPAQRLLVTMMMMPIRLVLLPRPKKPCYYESCDYSVSSSVCDHENNEATRPLLPSNLATDLLTRGSTPPPPPSQSSSSSSQREKRVSPLPSFFFYQSKERLLALIFKADAAFPYLSSIFICGEKDLGSFQILLLPKTE